MQSRRNLREQAFAIIFEKSICGGDVSDIIRNAVEWRKDAEEAVQITVHEYPESVARGVFDNIELIDTSIEAHCVRRSLSRLSYVVLAVLRLSMYEIIFDDSLDAAVSINEAVELAKKYAGDDEAGFVNGVLGSYVRANGVK